MFSPLVKFLGGKSNNTHIRVNGRTHRVDIRVNGRTTMRVNSRTLRVDIKVDGRTLRTCNRLLPAPKCWLQSVVLQR